MALLRHTGRYAKADIRQTDELALAFSVMGRKR